MATAKKLPSGSWRCQVFSHYEYLTDKQGKPLIDPVTGKQKTKRIYESFTSDDPSKQGKKEAELMAAEFSLNKNKKSKPMNLTLSEAIDKYIESSDAILSPTTIQGYKKIKRNSYQELMDIPLKNITHELLQTAVNTESKRIVNRKRKIKKTISPKSVKNSYGLISAVLNRYCPNIDCNIQLPSTENKIKELIAPEIIMAIIKDTEIELPALLAMWLSLSLSEIRGLKKSTSIKNGYLIIHEVVVDVNNESIRKQQAKTFTRIRKHKIPGYIQKLIDKTSTDDLVTMSGHAIYMRFRRLLKKNNLPHMTFHDLRHENASVMALLRIPDKYAMERGGWKTDNVMKKVYTHTFSEEREKVDEVIDDYFEKVLGAKNENIDTQKYKAWLTLFDKPDNKESIDEFKEFIQHEMQHKK
jgi:integrase